jgi:hypothetical protein
MYLFGKTGASVLDDGLAVLQIVLTPLQVLGNLNDYFQSALWGRECVL